MKKITAIIINGRHGGFVYPNMEYSPIINLPIVNEDQISIGESHDRSVRIGDTIEYKECFRSIDQYCVLYSSSGRWDDIKGRMVQNFKPTYPIRLW